MQTTAKHTPVPEAANPGPRPESRLLRWLHRLEDGVLVFALLSMIGMAVLQIVLRLAFHTGIIWGDEFVRLLVLWVGLLGAMSASRTDSHIRIDLVSRYLPDRLKTGVAALTQLATASVCVLGAWYGTRFVLMEHHYRSRGFADVPAWVCELIIPLGFAVIALRYVLLAINRFQSLRTTSSR